MSLKCGACLSKIVKGARFTLTNLLELLVVLCLRGVVHAAGVPLAVPGAPQVHEVRPEEDQQRSQDDADAADDEHLQHEELLLVLLLIRSTQSEVWLFLFAVLYL